MSIGKLFISTLISIIICIFISISFLFTAFDNIPLWIDDLRGWVVMFVSPVLAGMLGVTMLVKIFRINLTSKKIVMYAIIFSIINLFIVMVLLFLLIGGPPS